MTVSRRQILHTTAVLAAGGAVAFLAGGPAAAEDATIDLAEFMKPGALPDVSMGRDDAPVTIVEYHSLTCPHCAHFHEAVLPHLKEAYLDTGKARLVLRSFPLNNLDFAAFMLLRCQPKDKYLDLVATFYANQNTWAFTETPADSLLAMAKQVGYTQESFKACLTDQAVLDALSQSAARAAGDFKVDSTPSFFVNGIRQGGVGTNDDLDKMLAPFVKG